MRYKNVVSGYPKSIGILRIDGLLTNPRVLRRHNRNNKFYIFLLEVSKGYPLLMNIFKD